MDTRRTWRSNGILNTTSASIHCYNQLLGSRCYSIIACVCEKQTLSRVKNSTGKVPTELSGHGSPRSVDCHQHTQPRTVIMQNKNLQRFSLIAISVDQGEMMICKHKKLCRQRFTQTAQHNTAVDSLAMSAQCWPAKAILMVRPELKQFTQT
jgi:hypothetical protein